MTTQYETSGARQRAPLDASQLVLGGVSVIGGIAVIIYAQGMPRISEGLPGPGLFPSIIGGFFVLFGAVLLFQSVLAARRGAPEVDTVAMTTDTIGGTEVSTAEGAGAGADDAEPVPTGVEGGSTTAAEGRAGWINAAVVLAGIVFYVLAAEPLGFLITMFVILAAIMLVLRSRVLVAVLTAVGVTALLYAVFELLLLVQLPDGILGW